MAKRKTTELTTITAAALADGDWFPVVDVSDTTDSPTGTNKKIAKSELAEAAGVTAHLADTNDAHDASAISFSATGTISSTDVQAAIAELDSEKAAVAEPIAAAHISDTSDAHDASAISVLDTAGNYTATDVEAVLAELPSRYAPAQQPLVIATGGTSDDTATVAAQALLAEGGRLVFKSGVTYTLAYGYLTGLVLIPNNTVVEVQRGATIIAKSNSWTVNQIGRLFGFASSEPTEIHFEGEGTIDGNRRGGNGAATENCAGIFGSDVIGFSATGIKFKNFRSEAIYIGKSARLPERVRLSRLIVEDCGFPASGATDTTARQGVAICGGNDHSVTECLFDTIKGYAIDFEGHTSGDTFSNIHVSGNQFRDCEQGFVNVSSPDTISNVDVQDWKAPGLHTTVNTFVIPSATRNMQLLTRSAGDLSLTPGSTNWTDVGTIADLVLQGCHPGDAVEVSLSSAWDNAGTFRNLDVASIVSGSPANYWGTNSSTPVNGVSAWRGFSGTARPFGGSVVRRLTASDLDANGTLTLRFRYKLNSATTTVLTASDPHLQAFAKNHGPY